MAYTDTWNAAFEASPADSDNVSEGAERMRDLKVAVSERLDEDHYFDTAGTDADHGEHRKITFHAPISTPSNVANKAFLYSKDVSSKTELHWEDEDGDEVQLTAGGAMSTAPGFHDGTQAITFPTNGMAAAKFMLGNSNTIAWFYLNTAPPGWKALSTGADSVLAVSGGTGDYNVNGGNPDASATWTQANHTLTVNEMPTHDHGGATGNGASSGTWWNSDGGAVLNMTDGDGSGDQVASQANHTHPISTQGGGLPHNHGSSWRPKASVGKLFQLDTA